VPDKPAAEIAIDAELIRGLLKRQATALLPDAGSLPLRKVAEGWDSEIWRLGPAHAVRLPRRELAAPLVLNEQRVLPSLAGRLARTGVRTPAPLFAGTPGSGYPWPWSIVPWIEGDRVLDIPRGDRSSWSETLASALVALHIEAPADHPVNPVRGRPLATRAAALAERSALLRDTGAVDAVTVEALDAAWHTGLSAAPWSRPPVWIHGDLHPGNLLARDGALVGIIDFGDVTAGDPAYDLAVAWLAFDELGRARLRAATGSRYDAATWRRARAWAAATAMTLLAHSDDNPDYAELGRDAAAQVVADLAR
jgi:aminoglycoside phosphotransferase (APT) family kinase protein